ncbi:hypothetical protein MKX03_026189 [Papaver bracteatum]|nr:hypothetical protein MKX03_026189 [Papaver bracteatum]
MAAALARAVKSIITKPTSKSIRNPLFSSYFSSTTKSPPLPNDGDAHPITGMEKYIPGCDYRHWLIFMTEPGGRRANKQDMINCYVKTLAKVLPSKDPKEAMAKIYSVSCKGYFAFGCTIDEDTSNKLIVLKDVVTVIPDSYVDAENKDYGGELFENGKVVERSPDRQRRVGLEPNPSK